MRKTIAAILLAAALPLLLFASPSSAKDKKFKAKLEGFQEVPAVSTGATGEFRGTLNSDETEIAYELSYDGLEGLVAQAHIHFGQKAVPGGISAFLCGTATFPGPAGTPACPVPGGTVSGIIDATTVIGPSIQGIGAGEFDELVRAIRDGVTYVNVHSSLFPAGEIRGQIK